MTQAGPQAIAVPFAIGVVDGRAIVRTGIAAILGVTPDLRVTRTAANVAELGAHELDLVMLDSNLGDGSDLADNVVRLRRSGALVILLTDGQHDASVDADGRLHATSGADSVIGTIRTALAGRNGSTGSTAGRASADPIAVPADPRLSAREREVLALYASGEKAQHVAFITGLSRDTVTHYVSRIRAKYARVGRHADTKIDLYRRAIEDGYLSVPN
ncbi:response regulator transcription factor [Microbacteriaceae bacterium VKM Ac-2855]|nr:response regulator transcription factor [Microbacteriaceae bacterium VKM Ac-2855]